MKGRVFIASSRIGLGIDGDEQRPSQHLTGTSQLGLYSAKTRSTSTRHRQCCELAANVAVTYQLDVDGQKFPLYCRQIQTERTSCSIASHGDS